MTLTEETVTTTAQGNYNMGTLSYSQLIDADSITVTFDGVEYECPRMTVDNNYYYGGISQGELDFSVYPFAISSFIGGKDDTPQNQIVTQTAGTYSVKIEGVQEVVTTTPCFVKAVQAVMGETVIAHMTETYDSSTECTTYTLDITDADVYSIVTNGSKLKIIDESNRVYYPVSIWARDATPALRANLPAASVTIIFDAVPLVLQAMTADSTPRYLHATVCPSSN